MRLRDTRFLLTNSQQQHEEEYNFKLHKNIHQSELPNESLRSRQ